MQAKRNSKKRRIGKFEKIAFGLLTLTVVFYVVGIICIKSKESELNVTSQMIENKIATSQTAIDALNLSIEDKTKLKYLKSVATSRGYYYSNNSEITAYVETQQ